ncbi:sulfurtransferase-like selenium metabolism protein YedF [Paludibacterium paludis]|uniref:Selenium metabolism protein YedF n=1 Tax=Paludibacterium paludis TaxID=1225769 RepID=A0A918UC57_9NEIS|nr:sulfurtransferase-like selenium metabolism protein YedF [Paludibacterium paludis]GGY28246.1 hypothetical protein GCM10011289_34340 [Paludibacterium paludis]
MSKTLNDCVIVVGNDGLGQGDEALRHKVLGSYFQTLLELGELPTAVVFYTAGVKMVADDSPVLRVLSSIAAEGVALIACRTCLEHYGLMERVAVGRIGNMMQIVEAQTAAAKVITL